MGISNKPYEMPYIQLLSAYTFTNLFEFTYSQFDDDINPNNILVQSVP